jgi:hypothetical protein
MSESNFTVTIADPAVLTSLTVDFPSLSAVYFQTSGALPAGLVPLTEYFLYRTGASTFNVYDTLANATAHGSTGRVITTGVQSGTHTAIVGTTAPCAYTLADLKRAVNDATGVPVGTALGGGLTVGAMVGRAIEYVVTYHPWTWRKATTTIAFLANIGVYALPAAFGRMIGVSRSAVQRPVKKTTLEDIMDRRATGIDDGCLYWALTLTTQTSGTVLPLRTLILAPIPAAVLASAIAVSYHKLVYLPLADTNYPDIPYGFHGALYQVVRAMALANREPTGAEVAPEWQLANQLLDAAVLEDCDAQSSPMELASTLED